MDKASKNKSGNDDVQKLKHRNKVLGVALAVLLLGLGVSWIMNSFLLHNTVLALRAGKNCNVFPSSLTPLTVAVPNAVNTTFLTQQLFFISSTSEELVTNFPLLKPLAIIDLPKSAGMAHILSLPNSSGSGNTVFVTIRGTKTLKDMRADLQLKTVPYTNGAGQIHKGFYAYAKALLPSILSVINAQTNTTRVIVSGHSLGAALAQICGSMLITQQSNKVPVNVISFATPRVGDSACTTSIRNIIQPQGLLYTVVNTSDLIPQLPLSMQPTHQGLYPYQHVLPVPSVLGNCISLGQSLTGMHLIPTYALMLQDPLLIVPGSPVM